MDLIYSTNDEEDQELKQDTLDSLKVLVEEQAEEVAKYIRELEMIAKIQKEEAASLAEAAKKTQEKADKVLSNVQYCMQQLGTTELQAGAYQFKVSKGREIVEVDLDKLPSEYKIVETVEKHMDKNDLKKLIKQGTKIEGVSLVRKPDSLKLK